MADAICIPEYLCDKETGERGATSYNIMICGGVVNVVYISVVVLFNIGLLFVM